MPNVEVWSRSQSRSRVRTSSTLDDFIGSSKFSDRSETVKLAIRHLMYEESLWDAQRKYGSKTPLTKGEREIILAEIRQIRKISRHET